MRRALHGLADADQGMSWPHRQRGRICARRPSSRRLRRSKKPGRRDISEPAARGPGRLVQRNAFARARWRKCRLSVRRQGCSLPSCRGSMPAPGRGSRAVGSPAGRCPWRPWRARFRGCSCPTRSSRRARHGRRRARCRAARRARLWAGTRALSARSCDTRPAVSASIASSVMAGSSRRHSWMPRMTGSHRAGRGSCGSELRGSKTPAPGSRRSRSGRPGPEENSPIHRANPTTAACAAGTLQYSLSWPNPRMQLTVEQGSKLYGNHAHNVRQNVGLTRARGRMTARLRPLPGAIPSPGATETKLPPCATAGLFLSWCRGSMPAPG